MELKNLLEFVFKVQPKTDGHLKDLELKGDVLRNIHKELMETDTFANTNLVIIDQPTTKIPVDESNWLLKSCQTFRVTDNTKFDGDFHLYSIEISPRMYNTDLLHEFDDRMAIVSPNIYDPETFVPYKYIMLRWSPELFQDVRALGLEDSVEELKTMFHNLLTDVMNSLEKGDDKYLQKAYRNVSIQGIWKKRTGNGEITY